MCAYLEPSRVSGPRIAELQHRRPASRDARRSRDKTMVPFQEGSLTVRPSGSRPLAQCPPSLSHWVSVPGALAPMPPPVQTHIGDVPTGVSP